MCTQAEKLREGENTGTQSQRRALATVQTRVSDGYSPLTAKVSPSLSTALILQWDNLNCSGLFPSDICVGIQRGELDAQG